MLRILILLLFPRPFSAVALSSDVTSYTKVSRNGRIVGSTGDSSSSIIRVPTRNNTNAKNEGRSINDFVITVPPVYVTHRTPKLKKGEAIDYPAASRYSTLDREMIAKLDAAAARKQIIQQRFHPPVMFDHDSDEKTNEKPPRKAANSATGTSGANSTVTFLGPIFSGAYEYSPPEFLNDKPASKPTITIEKYPPTDDKLPDSYKPSSNDYHHHHHHHHAHDEHEADYPGFPSTYESNDGPKAVKFAGPNDRPFSFAEDHPYGHDLHDFPHEVIYDHVPEYHEHHHEHTTTEQPEMNDQRLDKRPYSYYFIGKKLWYVPLYFSIYFIVYIAALVLKSIARHKINFPAHLAEAAAHSKRSEPNEGWWNYAGRILEGVERFAETFGKSS